MPDMFIIGIICGVLAVGLGSALISSIKWKERACKVLEENKRLVGVLDHLDQNGIDVRQAMKDYDEQVELEKRKKQTDIKRR